MIQYSILKKCMYGLLVTSALLVAGCSQDEDIIVSQEEPTTGGVVLDFTTVGELNASTRTVMDGSAKQHVTGVCLYIYNGTGDAATLVKAESFAWGATTTAGATEVRRYEVQYKTFTPDAPYTFLAVGTDGVANTTFGISTTTFAIGSTLANAKAVLATGQTTTNIHTSELYAGTAVLTPTAANSVSGNVDLWRRVAGVMGWFTNIPEGVATIQIRYCTDQNTSVSLTTPHELTGGFNSGSNFTDFITSPSSEAGTGNVLVSIPVAVGYDATTVVNGGSYVMPAAQPASPTYNRTMEVILLNAAGEQAYPIRRVLLKPATDPSGTESGTGIIDPDGAFLFPIVANCIYALGQDATTAIDLTPADASVTATLYDGWDDNHELDVQ